MAQVLWVRKGTGFREAHTCHNSRCHRSRINHQDGTRWGVSQGRHTALLNRMAVDTEGVMAISRDIPAPEQVLLLLSCKLRLQLVAAWETIRR